MIIWSSCVCVVDHSKGADQDRGSVRGVLLHVQEAGEGRPKWDFNLWASQFPRGEAPGGRGGHQGIAAQSDTWWSNHLEHLNLNFRGGSSTNVWILLLPTPEFPAVKDGGWGRQGRYLWADAAEQRAAGKGCSVTTGSWLCRWTLWTVQSQSRSQALVQPILLALIRYKWLTRGCSFPALQAGTMVMIQEPNTVNKDAQHPAAAHRPRAEPAAKKSKPPAKPPQDPDAVFPCKKCGRYG